MKEEADWERLADPQMISAKYMIMLARGKKMKVVTCTYTDCNVRVDLMISRPVLSKGIKNMRDRVFHFPSS